ncbi:hypothetical protein FCM35_KLT16256 [Carex littledalei]|uniref:Uncharacterized protein n=1 Tax=Carex littledalei TaxID=544730 RepID=A0A833R5S1_9POAL|nr:hypothetical protein FCM35_KLT16256 [Carex littledalei]
MMPRGYVISVRRVSARLRANVEGSDTGRVTRSSSRKPLPPPQGQQGEEGTKPSKFHSTRRKSVRPKPMGCDHDGRRRSGRLNPILENEAEEHPSSLVRIRTYFGPNPYLSTPKPQPQPQPPPQPQPLPQPQPQPEPPPQPKPQPQPQPQPEPQPDNETADNTKERNPTQDADNFDPLFTYTAADTPQFSEDSDSMEDADNETVDASVDSPLPTSEPEYSSQPNSAATQSSSDTRVPSAEPNNSGGSGAEIPVLEDDGSRRFRKCRTLRSCHEAIEASGKDLDWSVATVQTGKRKRSGKGKKPDVKGVWGLAKPRGPTHPDSRPVLKVVGDAEFTSEPEDTKIVATIRLLTCECMPGPIRSFNMFPSRVRLQILFKFLQRYSWADGEDVGRCLDELFQTLKVANGNEMDDEAIWNLAVKGEDKRGRVYGFGQKSRMSKANREVEAMEASPSEPTKSTATSAEMGKRFTAEEVEQLIAAQETRHRAEMDKNRKGFAQDIAAQEARHRAEMDENRKQNEYNRACLKALFAKTGAEPPNFSEFTSNVQDSGVGEGDTGGGGGDIGGGGEPNNGK